MDKRWSIALWQQFGAAIDMLDRAIIACPPEQWQQRIWGGSLSSEVSAEFWYVAYHAVFWVDLYLFGSEEGFAPPSPYLGFELEPPTGSPTQPYTKDEVRSYLASTRQKCQTTLAALSEEKAAELVEFPWTRGEPVSYFELQIYSMRHAQEHAAQLSLFLGQTASDAQALSKLHDDLDWVARADRTQPGA